ncbi:MULTISPECIES: hypothetical protein [unclassified Synechococcus]|uniref:hypothetical protein n=1 Tax=unclassified Synechococcus TaxID=2626047 RepID=UPI000A80D852|nr:MULTISPECIES: hypothetical protein [unclassified Synechococcus]TWB89041.1 hypothetical protein FB106_11449 [Synechococcus sp. Ace-Pa]
MRFPSDPDTTAALCAVEQLARLVLDAFEREFWAGRHCRSALAAAPLRAIVAQLPAPPEPPAPPPYSSDPEHARLYGEALNLWNQIHHTHGRLHALLHLLDGQRPHG